MKLTRILILIFSVSLLASCTKYTCEDFKTGDYVYSDTAYKDVTINRVITGQREFEIKGKEGTEKVMRDIGEQTEVMMVDGHEVSDVYSVIWEGPCSYTLVFKSTSSKVDQFHTQYDTIRTRIKEITNKGYIFEANLYDEYPTGELIKVD